MENSVSSFSDAEEKEIIITCSLDEMIKQFFKEYVIVWHDPNVNSKEYEEYMAQLKMFCKVLAFTEWEKASAYIRDAKESCHVVTSGTNGELFVREICSNQNVVSISIFCKNEEDHMAWAIKYQKVSCVGKKFEEVMSRIKQSVLGWYKEASSLKLNLPAFAPIFSDSDKSDMNHLHHYLKVIPNFKNREQAKDDFVSLSKNIYSDEKNAKLVESFEKDYNEYNKEQTLRWYTAESFLYKVTNNCLRIATSDSIQYCRLLLQDIETAIKDEYHTKSKDFDGLLYRGAYLSPEEWASLKENVDREIEMHGFLSVSKVKNVAAHFMQSDPSKKVLITIIMPKGPNEEEQGFAEIHKYSKYPQEREVLFNVRSRFTVLEAEDASQDVPYRHLVLLYGAQGFRKYLTEQNPVQEVVIGDIEAISCSHCKLTTHEIPDKIAFRSLGNLKEEIYSCKNCLGKVDAENAPLLSIPLEDNEAGIRKIKGCLLRNSSEAQAIPFYGYKCKKCKADKQKFYFVCSDCGEKEKRWCENCFENTLNCRQAKHHLILETNPFSFWCQEMSKNELKHLKFQDDLAKESHALFPQAEMYLKCHEYEKAIQYYHTYLHQNETKGLNRNIAISYNNMGSVFHAQGEFKKALEHFLRALDIIKSVEGEAHPGIATINNNIGQIYDNHGQYDKALEFYLESLDIVTLAYGEINLAAAHICHNIGTLYDKQGQYEKALEYHMESLEIKEAISGENDPLVASSYHNIGLVYYNVGDLETALENYEKALEIRKNIYGENHPDIALSYNNIGLIYDGQQEYEKALEFHFKSLHISKSVCGENLSQIALSYNNIGLAYNNQGKHDKALEYYMKTLEIEKVIYGENHPHTGLTYGNIGLVYLCSKEFHTALEYFLKSLSVNKSVCKADHPQLALSYVNLGSVYLCLENYNEALQHTLKALEIQKSVFGENHPRVAETSLLLLGIYLKQGESQFHNAY